MDSVRLTCMTYKKDFDVPAEEARVHVLKNGRYAYRVQCPWKGKVSAEHPDGKELWAFKFCSAKAYAQQCERDAAARPASPSYDPESPA